MNTIEEIVLNLKKRFDAKKSKISFEKEIFRANPHLTKKEKIELKNTNFYQKKVREELEEKLSAKLDYQIIPENFEFLKQNSFMKKNQINILRTSSNYDEFKIYDPEFGIIQIGNDSSSKAIYSEHIKNKKFNPASIIFLNNYPRDKKPFLNDSLTFSDILPIYKKFITKTNKPLIIADYKENTQYQQMQNIETINNTINIEQIIKNTSEFISNDENETIFTTNKKLYPITTNTQKDFFVVQKSNNEFLIKPEDQTSNSENIYKIKLSKDGNINVQKSYKNKFKTLLDLNKQKRKNKYNSLRKVKRAIKTNQKRNQDSYLQYNLYNIIKENIKQENTVLLAAGTGNATSISQNQTDIIIAKGKKHKNKILEDIIRIDNYLDPITFSANTGLSPDEVNFTYITHRHEDHIKGLIPTIYYNLTKSKKNKINLAASPKTLELIKKQYDNSLIKPDNKQEIFNITESIRKEYSQNFNNIRAIQEQKKVPIFRKERINKKEIKEKTRIKRNILDIISFKAQHTVETYSPVIDTKENGRIYITSDIDASNNSLGLAIAISKNSSLTICDNGGTNNDPVHPDNNFVTNLRKQTNNVILVNHLPDNGKNQHIRLRQNVPYILPKNNDENIIQKIFLRHEKVLSRKKTPEGNQIIDNKIYPARYNYTQKKELGLSNQLNFGNFFDYYFENKEKILEDFKIELRETKKTYSENQAIKELDRQIKYEKEINTKIEIVDKLEEIISDEITMLNDDRKIDFLNTLQPTIQNLQETIPEHKLNIETLLHLDNMEELLRYYKNEIFGYEKSYHQELKTYIDETKDILKNIKLRNKNKVVYYNDEYVDLINIEKNIEEINNSINSKKMLNTEYIQNTKEKLNNLSPQIQLLANKIDKDYRMKHSFNEIQNFFNSNKNIRKYNQEISNIQERQELYHNIEKTINTIQNVRLNQDRHQNNISKVVGKIYTKKQPSQTYQYLIYEPTTIKK